MPTPRRLLKESLDRIFAAPIDRRHNLDAVESKLFGLGSESYVVGSHEFYLGYAATNDILLCLDSGHFHPTEVISDKLSAVLLYVPAVGSLAWSTPRRQSRESRPHLEASLGRLVPFVGAGPSADSLS